MIDNESEKTIKIRGIVVNTIAVILMQKSEKKN